MCFEISPDCCKVLQPQKTLHARFKVLKTALSGMENFSFEDNRHRPYGLFNPASPSMLPEESMLQKAACSDSSQALSSDCASVSAINFNLLSLLLCACALALP